MFKWVPRSVARLLVGASPESHRVAVGAQRFLFMGMSPGMCRSRGVLALPRGEIFGPSLAGHSCGSFLRLPAPRGRGVERKKSLRTPVCHRLRRSRPALHSAASLSFSSGAARRASRDRPPTTRCSAPFLRGRMSLQAAQSAAAGQRVPTSHRKPRSPAVSRATSLAVRHVGSRRPQHPGIAEEWIDTIQPRRAKVLFMKFRYGILQVKAFTFKWGLLNGSNHEATCELCNMETPETTDHVLLNCIAYDKPRRKWIRPICRNAGIRNYNEAARFLRSSSIPYVVLGLSRFLIAISFIRDKVGLRL
ncbi:hypothetical protein NDU88_004456 [Pleurodeles waltl]|uniref:Reverse transcriptase zinc-binding domain-containing protein n=1 Tax=Pleurodeles waltl TaxID=8319 RepID=A0AAV7W5B0_PLEWA|nr:hypothetical protein NDU88_004456 [Pleurodeles waltl]